MNGARQVLTYRLSDGEVQEQIAALFALANEMTVHSITRGLDRYLIIECGADDARSVYELVMTYDHDAVLIDAASVPVAFVPSQA